MSIYPGSAIITAMSEQRRCRRAGRAAILRLCGFVALMCAAGLFVGPVPAKAAPASSSPVLTWTKQAPATHPAALSEASMAYDAATGNVVLFGGASGHGVLNGTWVWDGTTWTKQAPATRPPARQGASMAYDAATGNMVLFGGAGGRGVRNGTWVWDGTTWTKQAPATRPPASSDASMAYDAATGNVVLFSGLNRGSLGSTWVWGSS